MFAERASAVGKAVLGVLAFYVVVGMVAWLLLRVTPVPEGAGLTALAVASMPPLIAALAVNWFFVSRGWSRWSTLGWRGRRATLRGFGAGLGIGVAMTLVAVSVAALGGAEVALTGEPWSRYLGVAAGVAATLALAALAEELLFRGYPLARLAVGMGRVPASIALAVPFALAHLWNPEVSVLGLVNIGLAALVLSAAFFTPGGLPAAWGVHLGWNGGLALGVDAPVSGIAFDLPVLDFTPGAALWLTGGAFGPEGGLAATLAMGAALIVLGRQASRRDARGIA